MELGATARNAAKTNAVHRYNNVVAMVVTLRWLSCARSRRWSDVEKDGLLRHLDHTESPFGREALEIVPDILLEIGLVLQCAVRMPSGLALNDVIDVRLSAVRSGVTGQEREDEEEYCEADVETEVVETIADRGRSGGEQQNDADRVVQDIVLAKHKHREFHRFQVADPDFVQGQTEPVVHGVNVGISSEKETHDPGDQGKLEEFEAGECRVALPGGSLLPGRGGGLALRTGLLCTHGNTFRGSRRLRGIIYPEKGWRVPASYPSVRSIQES